MDNYGRIRQAILDKAQVLATYNGHYRKLCPHVLGVKNGRRQALFFQFGGEGKSGLIQGRQWRCIPIDELEIHDVQFGPWHTDPGIHNQEQTCVDEVDVEVVR